MRKGKSVVKSSIAIVLSVITMLGVSGCMFTPKSYYKSAEKYLEEEYGEQFTIQIPKVEPVFASEIMLWAVPETHPEWEIALEYTKDGGWRDNYYGYLLSDKVNEYLRPFVEEVYGKESKVYVAEPGLNMRSFIGMSENTTGLEYLKKADTGRNVSIYTTKDVTTFQEDWEKLWELIHPLGFNIDFTTYYLTQEDFDSEVTSKWHAGSEIPYLYLGSLYISQKDTVCDEVHLREPKS